MHGINISRKTPKRSPAATDNNATEIIKKNCIVSITMGHFEDSLLLLMPMHKGQKMLNLIPVFWTRLSFHLLNLYPTTNLWRWDEKISAEHWSWYAKMITQNGVGDGSKIVHNNKNHSLLNENLNKRKARCPYRLVYPFIIK